MSDPESMKVLVDPDNLRALGEAPGMIEADFLDPNGFEPDMDEMGNQEGMEDGYDAWDGEGDEYNDYEVDVDDDFDDGFDDDDYDVQFFREGGVLEYYSNCQCSNIHIRIFEYSNTFTILGTGIPINSILAMTLNLV